MTLPESYIQVPEITEGAGSILPGREKVKAFGDNNKRKNSVKGRTKVATTLCQAF